ncbi:MAG: PGF-pre-PGF domain-containing protein, partial [Methanosarcina sp.]
KGSIAMGQNGQKDLSLTAFDLPKGQYYLCVAAYTPGIGIAGIAQSEIKIKSKQQYEEDEEDEEDDEPDYDGDDDEYDEDDDENDEYDEDDDQIDDGDENGDGKDDNGTGEKDGKKSHSKKKKVEPKEPKENVKAKEQCKKFVAKGAHVKFEFPKGSTCIEYVEFDSKKSTGATTATIEGLKAKSVFAPINPQGEIYNNFNIRIGKGEFTNPNNLKNGAVGFRVSKAWISENNIDIDSIALQHYINKKWKLLPTEEIIEDNDYVHFKAKTSSFSPFAISAEKKEITIEKEKQGQDSPVEGEGCNTKTDVQKDVPSEPKSSNNTLLKAAAFFAGLAIILVIGAVIMKKKENERKGPGQ